MQFTLYDYLIMYQYKIIEAVKSGFPKKSDYNQWIYNDIIRTLVDIREDDYSIFKPGVYLLGNYYIGKTSKPIILRIISHLFDTIPTPQTDITMQNYEKILCTKIDLYMDVKLQVSILSDNLEDEQSLIEDQDDDYNDYILMNKQYIRNRKTHSDYFKEEITVCGFCQTYGDIDNFGKKLNILHHRGYEKECIELYGYYENGENEYLKDAQERAAKVNKEV